jgi:hypothetical protein
MSRLDKPTDFSALLKKYADSPPIPRSGWNTDRERSNSEPSRHDMIRERLSNRFRRTYHDRTRTYDLRESEIFTLGELGKFRVISADDLSRFAYDGNKERLEQDIQHLKKQALVSQREIEARNSPKFRVFSLTRDGKRFLRQQNRVRKSQALYDGFAKPKELAHDAELYRLYQKVVSEIERNGGTVRRVVLDYELKEELYRDVNRLGPAKSPDQERERIASRHGLKLVDRTIPIPDLRIEYENEARHIEHIDMEFATREYRSQGMASKARAVFICSRGPRIYLACGACSASRNSPRGFRPVNIPRMYSIALGSFGYTEDEARFLCLMATHSGYFTCQQFVRFIHSKPGKRSLTFVRKLLEKDHASARPCLRNGQVYHLFSRNLYEAIGKDNVRFRRKHSLEYIRSRLAALDFILGKLDYTFFETEQEKVRYFTEQL